MLMDGIAVYSFIHIISNTKLSLKTFLVMQTNG